MNEKLNQDFDKKLRRGRAVLNYLNARSNRCLLDKGCEWVGKKVSLELNEIFLFQILEVTFEEKAPRKEAIENILGTLRGMEGISFIYLILGDASGVKFYFGAARDKSYPNHKMPFSVHDLEQDILTPSMKGNFRGSKVSEVNRDEKKIILERIKNAASFGILEGVPSVDEKNENFQGTDRLIDVMQGDEFGFAVIATPYTDAETDELEQQLFALSDSLMPLARHTIQRSTSSGKIAMTAEIFPTLSKRATQFNTTNPKVIRRMTRLITTNGATNLIKYKILRANRPMSKLRRVRISTRARATKTPNPPATVAVRIMACKVSAIILRR